MESEFLKTAEDAQFELLIDGLMNDNYGVCDNFIDAAIVEGLRSNLLNHRDKGSMHPAGIGKKFDYRKNAEVRGDLIKWIEKQPDDPFELYFASKVSRFIHYLNQTCYTSINDFEFHYAIYEPNSFYKRHLDQFSSDKGRKYSLVIYLNTDWLDSDGGNLALYQENEHIDVVFPIGGRAVFFKSDEIEHEVFLSPLRSRMSIAGWLKNV